jgi:hypothetical protein
MWRRREEEEQNRVEVVASIQHAKAIHTDSRCGKRLYPPKGVTSNLPAQACHWHAVTIKFYRSTPTVGTSVQTIK